jgi:hypothetical protein
LLGPPFSLQAGDIIFPAEELPMSAYVIFTKVKTIDPAEMKIYNASDGDD